MISPKDGKKTVLVRVRGWRSSRHRDPGANRWTWTNGAIDDTTRKVVKAKVFRLNGSRYTYKYSRRHRIVIVDHRRAHSLAECTYTGTYACSECWEAGIQCVCTTRKAKHFCSLSPAQTCTIKTLWRTGCSLRRRISPVFLYMCLRGAC